MGPGRLPPSAAVSGKPRPAPAAALFAASERIIPHRTSPQHSIATNDSIAVEAKQQGQGGMSAFVREGGLRSRTKQSGIDKA